MPEDMPEDMPEELFDVVDERDRPLRQLPRSEVHRQKLRHRAVHIFVWRTSGDLVIHRRSLSKEECPGVWTSSASGHVSAGDDYDETAPRELCEELGITADVTRLHKFAACPETSNEFTVLYQTTSDAAVIPDPEEIMDLREVNLAELILWRDRRPEDFSSAFLVLFDWYRSNRHGYFAETQVPD